MNNLANRLSPLAAILAPRAHLIALALFAAVGLSVLDDYGVAIDEEVQRRIGYAYFDYVVSSQDALTVEGRYSNRYYGVAFELPLIVAERLLGLEDSRAVYLSRRLMTHAFFLAGGFFAWLLAHRLFGNRLVALFAMLLFLLHPRIYAHSFFNTKDLPFLSAFMVTLYLTHRAFRRDSVWAFALCGAGVGLLAGVRVMGVMLVPAVLGMLALDGFHAMRRGWNGIKRALGNAGAFIASFAAALYAASPMLWRDPMELTEAIRVLSRHPAVVSGLFRGELVEWPSIPWDYIPAWALITSPPVVILFAALGIAAVATRIRAAGWRGMFADSTARFGLLMAACLILPVAAAVALNSNLYNGWRQMYFLYAPACVLAAFGLRFAAAPRRMRRLRAAAVAIAALGIAAVIVQMASLHPYQSEYFNFLVNKASVADRWEMDYWNVSHRRALERTLSLRPAGSVSVSSCGLGERPYNEHDLLRNFALIPREDRMRMSVNGFFPDFCLERGAVRNPVWTLEVYGETILSLVDRRDSARAAYETAMKSEPLARSGYDIYADSGALTYIKRRCSEDDIRARFFLSVFPSDPADLPQSARDAGFEHESLNFDFHRRGAILDGKCVIARDLPDYPIGRIETGQWLPGERGLWSAEFAPPDFYERRIRRSESSGEPGIRADFDVYLEGDSLLYIRKDCAAADTRGRFWLSVFPENPADLPQERRDAGLEHDSLNFDFAERGAILDGKCVIIRELPDYPIAAIETGQFVPNEGELWRGRIAGD